jgi:2,3-bisphosphoglycerate-dependent phosphoglycerate mutase
VTRLIYLRHGESNTTVARSIGGPRTCSGLSALGVQQAERLRDRWLSTPEFTPNVVISSQYPRARETAGIVLEAFLNVQLEIDDGFGEHDPGPECDGMKFTEFVERFGTDAWTADPFAVSFPGGETLAEFHFRVGRAIRRTIDRYSGQTVVVACHGGVIDAALRQALRTPPTGSFTINTLNTSITELVLGDGGMWTLRRYGDVAHLGGLPTATNPPG